MCLLPTSSKRLLGHHSHVFIHIVKEVTRLIIPMCYYYHWVNHSHVFITYIIKDVTRLIIPMCLLLPIIIRKMLLG